MIRSKIIKSIAVIMLATVTFIACKKDAFSEKDAIAAQTTLLQAKFNFDLMIKGIDLQIQRSKDSAAIAMIKLQYNADSTLERFKQANAIAALLQNLQNSRLLAMQADSLSRNLQTFSDLLSRTRSLWNDSVERAKSNTAIALALQKNYSLTFTDHITSQPVAGATVTVLPLGSSTFVSAITNAMGVANFTSLVVDPGAYFAISAPGYGSALLREASVTGTNSITTSIGGNNVTTTTKFNTTPTALFNSANTRNTIRGSILGDVNLTNGETAEAIVGHLITFTTTFSTIIYQFSAVSDVNGNYSVSVPDGTFTPVVSATVRVQQKLFVNAWQDEDQTRSIPRIDSTGTTLQANGASSPISNGTGQGYYYSFPSDTLNPTKSVFAAVSTATNGNIFQPNLTSSSPFAPRNLGTPKTDSLAPITFQNGFNLFLNNQNVAHNTDNSIVYSLKSKYVPAKTLDTLTVTLVSLVPGWIVTAPKLIASVDGNTGKISNILLRKTPGVPLLGPTAGAGGVFNNAVMVTPNNRLAYTNLTAFGFTGQPVYLSSLATTVATANNTVQFTLNSGNSYFLPIEYRTTIARDRTPR